MKIRKHIVGMRSQAAAETDTQDTPSVGRRTTVGICLSNPVGVYAAAGRMNLVQKLFCVTRGGDVSGERRVAVTPWIPVET